MSHRLTIVEGDIWQFYMEFNQLNKQLDSVYDRVSEAMTELIELS